MKLWKICQKMKKYLKWQKRENWKILEKPGGKWQNLKNFGESGKMWKIWCKVGKFGQSLKSGNIWEYFLKNIETAKKVKMENCGKTWWKVEKSEKPGGQWKKFVKVWKWKNLWNWKICQKMKKYWNGKKGNTGKLCKKHLGIFLKSGKIEMCETLEKRLKKKVENGKLWKNLVESGKSLKNLVDSGKNL